MDMTWQESNGDETYALDWPLDENSHVWEIGGFEGRWAQQIWDKFHCNITIFEPQLWAVERMKNRFSGISKIEIRPYGLYMGDADLLLGNFETDGTSLVNIPKDKPTGVGKFRSIFREVKEFKHPINLCLMNIEGTEYFLLPYMINASLMDRFENFWCQFHLFEEWNVQKTQEIFNRLEETHDVLWDFFPTAVAWRKR